MPTDFDTFYPFSGGVITSSNFGTHGSLFAASGVVANLDNCLRVYGDSSGKQVKVGTGTVLARHRYAAVASEKTITIADNVSGNPRIDVVVARYNSDTEVVELDVIQGTPAASPTVPAVTQNATTWEIPLAGVAVANGFSTITAGVVSDARQLVMNPAAVPWNASVPSQVTITASAAETSPLATQLPGAGIWHLLIQVSAHRTAGSTGTSMTFRLKMDGTTIRSWGSWVADNGLAFLDAHRLHIDPSDTGSLTLTAQDSTGADTIVVNASVVAMAAPWIDQSNPTGAP